jgi:hypothetical protein
MTWGYCNGWIEKFGSSASILQAFFQAPALLKYGTMRSYIAVCGHMNTVLTGVLTYSIFILH